MSYTINIRKRFILNDFGDYKNNNFKVNALFYIFGLILCIFIKAINKSLKFFSSSKYTLKTFIVSLF